MSGGGPRWWRQTGAGTRWLLGIWMVGSLGALAGLWSGSWLGLEGSGPGRWQVWRWVSHALLTADVLGLLVGGFFLWWLGSAMERTMGAGMLWSLYLAGAVGTGGVMALLGAPGVNGWLTNSGALLALLVAWGVRHRHERMALMGGPEISGAAAAGLVAAMLVLPVALMAGPRLALSLAGGALGGWLVLRGCRAASARRGKQSAAQSRVGRLEL